MLPYRRCLRWKLPPKNPSARCAGSSTTGEVIRLERFPDVAIPVDDVIR